MFVIALFIGGGVVAIMLNSQTNTFSSSAPETSTATTTVTEAGVSQEGYTTPICVGNNGSTKVMLIAEQAKVQIAPNITYDSWSLNGTVPGPTIWVNMCESIDFTLINNDTMPHSIDFHAAQVNWAVDYAAVAPGQSLSFNFTPAYPGVFMYHCGVPPILEHVSNGMYGVIIVNGTGTWSLPPAPGGTYVITESEFYLNDQPNSDGAYSGNYSKMLAATPDYVVFNGKAFQYVSSHLEVKPNELVRLYVFNEGPNEWEAFHVIGAVMDSVYMDGNPFNVQHGLQTVSMPPSGGAIVDLYFTDPGGLNPFVNHALAYQSIGAQGIFQVLNSSESNTTTSTESSSAFAQSGPQVIIESGSAANTTKTYYSASTLTVVIGTNNTITWINDDISPHTVTSTNGIFNSGNMNFGQTWTHTFTEPGTYEYSCIYHPWMTGTVIVKAA